MNRKAQQQERQRRTHAEIACDVEDLAAIERQIKETSYQDVAWRLLCVGDEIAQGQADYQRRGISSEQHRRDFSGQYRQAWLLIIALKRHIPDVVEEYEARCRERLRRYMEDPRTPRLPA